MLKSISPTYMLHGQSKRAKKRAAKWRLAQMIKKHRGCIDCGYNAHGVALQFDHVEDNKKASVSNLIRSDYCWATIMNEINKCVVRCANCHAIITSQRKNAAVVEQQLYYNKLAAKTAEHNPTSPNEQSNYQ